MKFGKVYTFANKDEAKKLIGEYVACENNYAEILNLDNKRYCYGVLNEINADNKPFQVGGTEYQFIREMKRENMTNRQLAEWCARGFGQFGSKDCNCHYNEFVTNRTTEDEPVESDILIRPWGSDEWIEPTVDIYERDCKGVSK